MSEIHRPPRRASILIVAGLILQATVVGIAVAQTSAHTVPPPTPVPPNGSPSPFPSSLRTPADPLHEPHLSAGSVLLADLETGRILFQKASRLARPIASVTKVMTALIVLERTAPSDEIVVSPDAVFEDDDYGSSSTLGLVAGERLTVGEVTTGMLLGSANDAAVAIAIHVAGSEASFVQMMNRRAAALGMDHTTFYSSNGLDDRGRSTARDLLRLARAAYATPGFAHIVARRAVTLPAPSGPPRHIQNRNVLLWLYPGAIGIKTGFTQSAGFCLMGAAERNGRRLVVIVLHAAEDAFSDAASLLNYGFEGFTRRALVQVGDPIGSVHVRGGEVAVAAGRGLTALVPTLDLDRLDRTIEVNPRAAFPPAPGQRVGTLKLTVPGLTVGTIPLVVSRVPAPSPVERPWWARAAASVGRAVVTVVNALLP